MKKIITFIISIALTVSITACGSSPPEPGADLAQKEKEAVAADDGSPEKLDAPPAGDINGDISGEIDVVFYDVMFYKDFLDEAAAAFEAKYPGTKINVTGFSKMPEIKTMETEDGSIVSYTDGGNDPKEMQDYISRINTELMSGSGPDILAMDVFSYYKLAESGLLENLLTYMEADQAFDISNYRSNIFEGVRYKGGQYILPLDFAFDFISLDKTRVSDEVQNKLKEKGRFTYEELIDSVKEQFSNDESDARMIDYQGKSGAFGMMWRRDYKKYIDIENKKANLTDGSFSGLLSMINEHGDNGYFIPSFESSGELTQDFMDSWSLYYFKNQTNYTLKQVFYPYEESELPKMFAPPKQDEIAGLLVNDEGEAHFLCYQTYAVNANSRNKSLSWEFIKFMLSEDMQLSLKLLGIPVNNKAFDEYTKINMTKFPNYQEDGTTDGFYEPGEQKYTDAHEAFVKCVTGFIDDLNYYTVSDEVISGMVGEAVAAYFEGARSAEETAAMLQNQVDLYLGE